MIIFQRSNVIETTVSYINQNTALFSTTGQTSRECLNSNLDQIDFLPCVGGMGFVSSMALGFAISSKRPTICFDGDGSFLMHLGANASITSRTDISFLHILFDNSCHLSVGGFPTNGTHLNFPNLANSLGYKRVIELTNLDSIKLIMEEFQESDNRAITFLYVRCHAESMSKLPRPTDLKSYVMKFLEKSALGQ